MCKTNLLSGAGLKSILLSIVFSLLVNTGFTQSIQTVNSFLGQTPPGNTPKALPLFVNQGFFAAERIAISNDGRDIYYSEIKGYYPITGENIKRYTFADGKWNGPFDLFVGYALAVSYRKADGSWTNPRVFGKKIDFGLGSWGPWVTPDNKYLFYSTGTKPDYSDVKVYWVRIDGVIDSLKHTNLSPYIKSLIQNQSAVAGQPFTFTVPDNIFFDDDNKIPLTYSSQMIDGKPIPAWIVFDPATRTFSGTPAEAGELTVIVVVTDSEKATAYCPVKIIIAANPIKSKQ